MKLFIAIITAVCSYLNCHSQIVYFGHCIIDSTLKEGDVIILNIPRNIDGKFIHTEDLFPITELLNRHPHDTIVIGINTYYGSSEMSLGYSKALARNMAEIFNLKKAPSNYHIISEGSSKPIFLNKHHPLYKKLNSRIEIRIKPAKGG